MSLAHLADVILNDIYFHSVSLTEEWAWFRTVQPGDW